MLARLELPAEPASVPSARRFVRSVLDSWALGDVEDGVVLVTSELVTNALLHSGGSMWLELRATADRLRVSVRDTSPSLPTPRRRVSEGSGTGRGLLLVEHTATAWGTEPVDAPPGKVVWAEIATPATAAAGPGG